MTQAHALLKDNVTDYTDFIQRMRAAYHKPEVVLSYKNDKGRMLQLTDWLYMGELLDIPHSVFVSLPRRAILYLLRLFCNK